MLDSMHQTDCLQKPTPKAYVFSNRWTVRQKFQAGSEVKIVQIRVRSDNTFVYCSQHYFHSIFFFFWIHFILLCGEPYVRE